MFERTADLVFQSALNANYFLTLRASCATWANSLFQSALNANYFLTVAKQHIGKGKVFVSIRFERELLPHEINIELLRGDLDEFQSALNANYFLTFGQFQTSPQYQKGFNPL